MQEKIVGIKDCFLLAALLALFIATRFMGLESQSFWLDELNLARIASELNFSGNLFSDINSLFQTIRIEPHPPLYFVLCKIWACVFGYSMTALRSLSIFWLVIFFILAGIWSHRQFGSRFACLLLLILTFSQTLFAEAQHFRPYAFNILLGGIIGFSYLHFLQNTNARGRLSVVCAALLVASLAHYSAVIFTLALAGHQFLYGMYRDPKDYLRWSLNAVMIMAAAAPALVWYLATFQDLYMRHAGDLSKQRDLLDRISIFRAFTGFPGLILLLILPVVAGPGSMLQNVKNIRQRLSADAVFGACLALGALHYVLVNAASLAQPSILQNKNFYIVFPVMFLAFTRYVMVFADDIRIYRSAIALGAIGFVTLLVTGYPMHKASYFQPWREQVREVAKIIKDEARPGDIILFGTVSMTGYLLQPTKIYLTLIEGRPEILKDKEILDFPPQKTYIIPRKESDIKQRLSILSDTLEKLRRDSSRRLFIDFPHEQTLWQQEIDLVVKSGFCVHITHLVSERIIRVENPAPSKGCSNWPLRPGQTGQKADPTGF